VKHFISRAKGRLVKFPLVPFLFSFFSFILFCLFYYFIILLINLFIYHLKLLESLLKATPEGNKDTQYIPKAMQDIKMILSKIDELTGIVGEKIRKAEFKETAVFGKDAGTLEVEFFFFLKKKNKESKLIFFFFIH